MSMAKVYITGLSALTASGQTIDATWSSILDGKTSWQRLEGEQYEGSPWALGGEVKPFNPRSLVKDKKILKLISRKDILGLNAASQAIEDSGLLEFRETLSDTNTFNDRTGVYVGSPGNKYNEQYDFVGLTELAKGDMHAFADNLFSQIHPMWILKILPNNVLAYTGIQYGFKGPNQNVTNHVNSGMQAVIEAYSAIKSGQADRAVVVAYDHGYEPQALSYYGQLGVLSDSGIKPFDSEHNGTVLAEGACALILESENSVSKRAAKTYGELLAYGSSADAKGIFSIDEEGRQLEKMVVETLNKAQCQVDDIGLVTGHANANPRSDDTECHLFQTLFPRTPITGFKWAMGHTLAASSLLDTVLTTYALKEGIAPGIATLTHLSKSAKGLSISNQHQDIHSPLGLIISRGFGGMNTCLLVKSND